MTITTKPHEAAEQLEEIAARLVKATATYMSRLNNVVDIGTLTTGSHGYDYTVTVDGSDMLRILPLLAGLTYDLQDEFGIKITTLAVPNTDHKRSKRYDFESDDFRNARASCLVEGEDLGTIRSDF